MHFQPWPNEVASRQKLKTWVYLRLGLARTCVYLRWLVMTCAQFGWDQICTQVKASFPPFGHPTQVNASWGTSIERSLLFYDMGVLARKLASPFGHSTQVSTQVDLASTCDYLTVRLTRTLWKKHVSPNAQHKHHKQGFDIHKKLWSSRLLKSLHSNLNTPLIHKNL